MKPLEVKKCFCPMVLTAAVISFLGFVLENIWLLLSKGVADNRNMSLPFLAGYGIGVVGLYLLLGTPRKPLPHLRKRMGVMRIPLWVRYALYFLVSFVAVTAAEVVLGAAFEYVMGFAYWDYSELPLTITRYSSVLTSAGFALIITLFMSFAMERLIGVLSRLPLKISLPLSVSLGALMTADMLLSFYIMYIEKEHNILWQICLFSH